MAKLNRKNLPKWTKPLTLAEVRHLRDEAGGLSLAKLKNNLAHQKQGDCWTCWGVGKKLGLA